MKHSHRNRIIGILSGILFTLFFISLGVITAIQWRGLYYHDIRALKLSESTGYSEAIIRENYDALMDYCSPFYQGELNFPTLPSSTEGLVHFAEVKTIFVSFYYILVISLLLLLPILWFAIKHKEYKIFKVSFITSLLLPCIIGLACILNFDATFLLFHKLVFRNNYWLFNPYTDPIINLLPPEFFYHCAILIISIVLLGAILQFLSSWYLKKRANHSND